LSRQAGGSTKRWNIKGPGRFKRGIGSANHDGRENTPEIEDFGEIKQKIKRGL